MHKLDQRVTRQSDDGTWSAAIPMPYMPERWWQKITCECGKKFKSIAAYESHYIEADRLAPVTEKSE